MTGQEQHNNSSDEVLARVRDALAEIVADESVPFDERLAARRGLRLADEVIGCD